MSWLADSVLKYLVVGLGTIVVGLVLLLGVTSIRHESIVKAKDEKIAELSNEVGKLDSAVNFQNAAVKQHEIDKAAKAKEYEDKLAAKPKYVVNWKYVPVAANRDNECEQIRDVYRQFDLAKEKAR